MHPGRAADDAMRWLTEQFGWEHTLAALLGVDLDLAGWRTEPPRRDQLVNVRYLVDDVDEAVDFYTEILDFELLTRTLPAFADVKLGGRGILLRDPSGNVVELFEPAGRT